MAVEFLRRAIDQGFRNVAQLRRDTALQAVRDRPEFQALLDKLK